MFRKTKIVVTLGPSTESEEKISKLIDMGVDVFRFNFSHGSHEYHNMLYERVRRLSAEKGRYVATLLDLSGPKIRIGVIKQPFPVAIGDKLVFKFGDFVGDKDGIPINIKEIFDAVKVGNNVYLADGTIKLRVLETNKDSFVVKVLTPGIVSSKKGVNLPDSKLNISSITDKDIEDIRFGIEKGFDFIALSFVKSRDDVLKAKDIIHEYGGDIPVFAKIEKFDAVENIDEIVEISDGIMVARGDLGIEIDMEKVPVVQKMIINKANEAAKPVITATQMLTTMVKHSRPTRAEVSDIANAVLDGTDAVMLSDETTVGEYPLEAVNVMVKTIIEAEKIYNFNRFYSYHEKGKISSALAETAVRLSSELIADGIVVFTKSGSSARRVSRSKPKAPIFAVATEDKVLRRLAVSWGVIPYSKTKDTTDSDELLKEFLIKSKDDFGTENVYIATIGHPAGVPGSTNVIRTIRKQDYEFFLK
ncbi:pyruvate kinase [Deferribacter desulfuricans SSM1]|uniref:Pyruvate kinase n=1 Tax=Deferribacter desulfuricans (strain DSM 14783 / JCM 11476 / NBRC 101012 / SSM1) TaxID=639282 RepID=D3PDZ3_DEFDS|nr:pyruvate kinase [Deferribacter desulfuricans]BAI80816.1 pyruvate kinase [Deferribacter desulfuricans SSM1]